MESINGPKEISSTQSIVAKATHNIFYAKSVEEIMESKDKWLSLFNSSNLDIRIRAARNLLIYHKNMSMNVLLEILDELHYKGLGADTERLILERRDPNLRLEMLKRVSSSSPFVREVACKYLKVCKNKDDLPILLSSLQDENNMVRLCAISAIREINEPSCAEELFTSYKLFIENETDDLNDSNVKWFIYCLESQLKRFGIN